MSGLWRGGFSREGYRATLSRVERRERSEAVPLVSVYSRQQARRLFACRNVDIRTEVHQFQLRQAGRPGRRLENMLGKRAVGWNERLARWIGWYIIARARKAAA